MACFGWQHSRKAMVRGGDACANVAYFQAKFNALVLKHVHGVDSVMLSYMVCTSTLASVVTCLPNNMAVSLFASCYADDSLSH